MKKKSKLQMPFWAEILIFFVCLIVVIGITVLAIYLQPSDTTFGPTITPTTTVTFIPPNPTQNVTITTKITSQEIVCIGFDRFSSLQFGNCGDPSIQGSWMYDNIRKIATNSISATSQSNCIINPQTIVNPNIFGQPISGSVIKCQNINLNATNGFISGITSDGDIIYIGMFENTLVWVTDPSHAQVFEIQF